MLGLLESRWKWTPQDALTGAARRPYVGRFAPHPPVRCTSVRSSRQWPATLMPRPPWPLADSHRGRRHHARCSARRSAPSLAQLACYGFVHDGDIVRQSERPSEQAWNSCAQIICCSPARTRKLETVPRNTAREKAIYPGTCRDRRCRFASNASRVRVPTMGADGKPFRSCGRRHHAASVDRTG